MFLTRASILTSLLVTALPAVVFAQTGVDDDRVSLPDGPGSREGVGDDVQVDPNMGLMRWAVPFAVPSGYAGLTPALRLSYSSGSGNGTVGIGWSFSTRAIERMVSRGVPAYDGNDRFFAEGSEVVQVAGAGNELVFRSRQEGSFVRYTWKEVGAGAAGYWTAEYPDGRIGYFGATAGGTAVLAAREASPDGGVFRYMLVDLVDRWGHRVHYSYDDFDGNVPLLTSVEYVHVANAPRYRVLFDYETRSDVLSDCTAGFEEELRYRLSKVSVLAGAETVRSYELKYDVSTGAQGTSRLTSVVLRGLGGAPSGPQHPLHWTFQYSAALGAGCSGASCARPYVTDMGTLAGAVDLAAGNATLVDINGDGLPDVLDTSGTGPHRFHIAQLTPQANGTFAHSFAPPVSSAVATGATFPLSSHNVQVLDLDGDGHADVVNTITGQYLLNAGTGADWASNAVGLDIASLPDFTSDAFEQLRFIDVNNDKRIDILQSTASETRVYRNDPVNGFVAELADTIGTAFEDGGLQLADMNGDGLNDPVEILSSGAVRFRLSLGNGRWTAWRTISGATVSASEAPYVDLEDLDGDGLNDLVIVSPTQVKYARNRNADHFDPFVTVQTADVDGEIPARETGVTVLYADMNGNGSEDIVWVDAGGHVRYLELFPVRPHLLTRIENGIGMVQLITYGSSVQHAARARQAGAPWSVELPNSMLVVDRIDLFTANQAADDGTGIHDIVDYVYRDGFFDGREKQFRGFAQVELLGDEDAYTEASRTKLSFDVGKTDTWRAGLRLSEQTESGGRVIDLVSTTYEDCPLADVPTAAELEALGRFPVRFVCPTADESILQEGTAQADWVKTRIERTWDGYGNILLESELGVVERGGVACGASCVGDERYTETAYATPTASDSPWILNLPKARFVSTSTASGAPRTEDRFFYDGPSFVGLAEGVVERGFLSRRQQLLSSGVYADVARMSADAHGNVAERIDALGAPDSNGHHQILSYDDAGLLPTVFEGALTDSANAAYRLRREYIYDARFQQPTDVTNWMLVRNGSPVGTRESTRYRFDDFGRTISVIQPGDNASTPSVEFGYEDANPVSRIAVRYRSQVGGAVDEMSYLCRDGRGRTIQARTRVAPGRYIVSDFATFGTNNEVYEAYQPFESASATCETTPPSGVLAERRRYDGIRRLLETTRPDQASRGTASVRRMVYRPLATESWDESDTDASSSHAGTPTKRFVDGLERLTAVERPIKDGNATRDVRVTYAWDELSRFAGWTDSTGDAHLLHSDLGGRVVEAFSADRGTIAFGWDAAGNLVSRTDASGTVRSEFDGLNRRVARYVDGARATTEVRWRWDTDSECAANRCTNGTGQLVSTSYPLDGVGLSGRGLDQYGYDVRERLVLHARSFGARGTLEQRVGWDGRDRLNQVTSPDGTVVSYSYDGLGRVVGVPGFVSKVEWDARGEKHAIEFDNGVRQSWDYDELQQLSALAMVDGGGSTVRAQQLTRERNGRLLNLEDKAPAGAMPSGIGATLDSWGRPVSLTFNGSAQDVVSMRYGDDESVLERTSSRGSESGAHVGTFSYRDAGHILAQAGALTFGADAEGRIVQRGTQTLSWDQFNRLTTVKTGETVLFSAAYDADDERVARLQGSSLTLYGPDDAFELQDGVGITYVRVDGERVARKRTTSFAASIYSDVAPGTASGTTFSAAPDGVINAGDAWISLALEKGILTGASGDNADLLLTAAARRLLVEAEDARTFLHTDHLGSLVAATDEGGAVRGRREFYPWGGVRAQSGAVDEHGFTGQIHDEATGLIHFRFRELDPVSGRWMSPDPLFESASVALSSSKVAEAVNPYGYVANELLDSVDPDGLAKGGKAKTTSKTKKPKKKKDKKEDSDADGSGADTDSAGEQAENKPEPKKEKKKEKRSWLEKLGAGVSLTESSAGILSSKIKKDDDKPKLSPLARKGMEVGGVIGAALAVIGGGTGLGVWAAIQEDAKKAEEEKKKAEEKKTNDNQPNKGFGDLF